MVGLQHRAEQAADNRDRGERSCPVRIAFTGTQVRAAMAGSVLAEATHSGTYTLNRRLAA